ncbi:MAG TPA: hypothetical protein VFX37_11330 [Pseudolabrys sp.]|nr:hypothetical protein [Pseudolabrys sp.]
MPAVTPPIGRKPLRTLRPVAPIDDHGEISVANFRLRQREGMAILSGVSRVRQPEKRRNFIFSCGLRGKFWMKRIDRICVDFCQKPPHHENDNFSSIC